MPEAADILDVRGPGGVGLTWLARGHRPVGEVLVSEARRHLGTSTGVVDVSDDEVDVDLWETPTLSSAGEGLSGAERSVGSDATWGAPQPGGVHGLLARGRRDALPTPGV